MAKHTAKERKKRLGWRAFFFRRKEKEEKNEEEDEMAMLSTRQKEEERQRGTERRISWRDRPRTGKLTEWVLGQEKKEDSLCFFLLSSLLSRLVLQEEKVSPLTNRPANGRLPETGAVLFGASLSFQICPVMK